MAGTWGDRVLCLDADPAHLKVLWRTDRACPCPHGIGRTNQGKQLTFQHAEFADEAFLLLLGQTAVATSPQQAVPAPGPDEKALDRFRLGGGRTRGVNDVHAEPMEHFPLLAIRQTDDQAFSRLILRWQSLDAEATQLRQTPGITMPGAILENEEAVGAGCLLPSRVPKREIPHPVSVVR